MTEPSGSNGHRKGPRNTEVPMLPEPEDEPTISVERAGRALGLGRNGAYGAAHRGDFPVIMIGRKMRVPTAAIRKLVGLDR